MPYTDFHYTPTGTGVISGKEVLEQTEDAINDLGTQISGDVQTAIDTANNALNTANTASADAQNAVNTANTAYTAATNAQNTANAAQNTASNALTAAQNAQNDVNALGNRVTTAENNISQNTTDISGLTTRMGTAENNISTLQNDVITAQGSATSAQNTATMARQQAYVLRYSSTAITDNSTIAYSTLDNTDNIKVSDKIIDSDGKIFSIALVDSANETVTVGSALIDLALDANVMHLSGDETSNGIKTFNNVVPINGAYLGNEPSTTFRSVLLLRSRSDTAEKSGWLVSKFRSNAAQGALGNSGSVFLSFDVLENEVRTNGILRFYLSSWSGNAPRKLFLLPDSAIESFLGSPANKWAAINGINPGALSLPDLSNGIDISGYFDATQISTNTYTALADGYISLAISSPNRGSINAVIGSDFWGTTSYGAVNPNDNNSYLQCMFMPILKSQTITVYLRTTGGTMESAKFFPCLGNV